MLHKTIPPIDPQDVAGIVKLQIRLLRLAASTGQLDKAAVENWFPESELAGWIVQNWPCSVGSLKQFAKDCPTSTKSTLVATVEAELHSDSLYWLRLSDPSFALQFAETDEWRRLIAKWLKGFYDQFRQAGFDRYISGKRLWNKREWEAAFRSRNPTVKTCPQCDGTLKRGWTAEHVLPRSKYASLSVHPVNLVPCCCDCQEWKGNKDPIETVLPNRLFLPYWQHALGHCAVIVSENLQGSWDFALVSQEPTNDWGEALEQLRYLYGIPDQWNRDCRDIVDLALSKIEEKVAADRLEGRVIDSKAKLQDILAKLCHIMKEQWGRQHYFVPATAWIEWAKDNMLDPLWQQYGTSA